MARTVAELPKGSRLTDYISLGVLNQRIPRAAVDEALCRLRGGRVPVSGICRRTWWCIT